VNAALKTAIPVQARSSELNQQLEQTMTSVENLVKTPTTNGALRGLTATVTTLQPQLRFLGPYVTVCNSWNYFWTLVAEHFSAPDATGGSERAMLNQGDPQLPGGDDVDTSGANEFAHGAAPATPDGVPQFLHGNFYGEAITPSGQASCAAGQQGYMYGWNPSRDKGVAHDPYRRVVVDHPPSAALGPTYAMLDKESHGVGLGPAAVPPGETFTARPGGLGADVP
jgi:hypothetical protein